MAIRFAPTTSEADPASSTNPSDNRPSYGWAVIFGILGGAIAAHTARKRGVSDTAGYWLIGLISTLVGIPIIVFLAASLLFTSAASHVTSSSSPGTVAAAPAATGGNVINVVDANTHTPIALMDTYATRYPIATGYSITSIQITNGSGWQPIAPSTDLSNFPGRAGLVVNYTTSGVAHSAGFNRVGSNEQWTMNPPQ